MSELIKHSFSQQLMYPDELTYSLNLIPTPKIISTETKNKFIFIGIALGLTAGITFTTYLCYQKQKSKNSVSN